MLQESLIEKILVADYCVKFRKDYNLWRSYGCYGYPAAVLLLSVVDTIGSFVIGKKTREHFDILDHPDYYNLGLGKKNIDTIYKNYRNLLVHNSVIACGCFLDIGNHSSPVFEIKNKQPYLNLAPLLEINKIVVAKFLSQVNQVVYQSEQLEKILKLQQSF